MQAVDRVRRDLHGRVEAERDVGAREVVVDRLRHADHGDAVVAQAPRDPEGVLAADGTSASMPRRSSTARIAAEPSAPSAYGFVRDVPRIVPPRGRMPAVLVVRQLDRVVGQHARPAVAEADDRVALAASALRTTARITAFRPGQSPPPVRIPRRMRPT